MSKSLLDHSKPALHTAGLKSASHEGLDHIRSIGERKDAHRSRSHDHDCARCERVAASRDSVIFAEAETSTMYQPALELPVNKGRMIFEQYVGFEQPCGVV
jgi:hypothetical protein